MDELKAPDGCALYTLKLRIYSNTILTYQVSYWSDEWVLMQDVVTVSPPRRTGGLNPLSDQFHWARHFSPVCKLESVQCSLCSGAVITYQSVSCDFSLTFTQVLCVLGHCCQWQCGAVRARSDVCYQSVQLDSSGWLLCSRTRFW